MAGRSPDSHECYNCPQGTPAGLNAKIYSANWRRDLTRGKSGTDTGASLLEANEWLGMGMNSGLLIGSGSRSPRITVIRQNLMHYPCVAKGTSQLPVQVRHLNRVSIDRRIDSRASGDPTTRALTGLQGLSEAA